MSDTFASYDPTLPTATDRLRFRLGDTLVHNPDFGDVIYRSALELQHGDEPKATLAMARALLARYRRLLDGTGTADDATLKARFGFLEDVLADLLSEQRAGIGTLAVMKMVRSTVASDEFAR